MEQGKPFSATESPLVDFDAVCQKIRAAVEPARAHAVSLHDENGDVLWLSESSMGPDEHNAVREALETFSNADSSPVLAFDLGDARSAVLVRSVNARRALVGVVMLILDSRIIKDARGPIMLMTPKMQRALADFAVMRPDVHQRPLPAPTEARATAAHKTPPLPPAGSKTGATAHPPDEAKARPPPRAPAPASRTSPSPPRASPPPAHASPPPAHASPPLARASPPLPAAKPARATAAPAVPVPMRLHTSEQSAGHSERSEKRPHAVPPEIDRLHAALRRSPIALHVQRLVPLTKGSQLKRYEVLLRSKSDEAPNAAPQAMLKAAVDNGLGSMIDRRVITELVGWLVHHPDVWQPSAAMFSVNLTATALHDEHFIKFVGLCLAKSSLPKATIAFEIDVATAVKLSARVVEVAASLYRLGCPLVLDDFALKTECFDLLRLPGTRYVKLAPELTAKMRTDKISQASITAIVQMARVLGMHTVAKHTETSAEQEWLTALGVDFVQSHAVSPPAAIDTLSKAQKAD
ncbi:MAG TPA: EAL domain-containing protein [Steroidobacteraceae bacterium]|jgi:EAL domain-containing protein (putative c-di-GMP-specific phosphodiesterase class I)|nr:EAL domain-containing protein [Steroidobacteraceae bacterium]